MGLARRGLGQSSQQGLRSRTHHCEGHELQDAAAAALLQAVHALLHEPLDELGVRAGCLGSQDRGDQQEEVCWRGGETDEYL